MDVDGAKLLRNVIGPLINGVDLLHLHIYFSSGTSLAHELNEGN